MDVTGRNFIEDFIVDDLAQGGQFEGMQIHTRFPPEPNGYLHIGHCKALTIDFSTAEHFGGLCNLRFDDTNPAKEDTEYVEAIQQDIHWLGFDWGDRLYYGSDYFDKTYEYAIELIRKGLAYVCELTPEQFREYRGDTTHPAVSPWRDRPIEENLDLFERMKNGEFPEGKYTLRAKIDLASGNFNMRDPVLYRIRYIEHHRAHRPLYDWVVSNVSIPYHKPRQIEFARLGINYTVMSKRKLRRLVEEGRVSGWDDPRMPTLCGLRRRGYTSRSIRNFCERIGVSKVDSTVDWALLESCLRDDLNAHARRVMAVLHPLKLIITNYPEGQTETLTVENNPLEPEAGTREVSFSRELYIEQDDFMEVPAPKYKRMHPGFEVRLKGAYLVTCTGVEKDENGNITAVLATYDPESRGGDPADGRKVKGATIHWVDANTAVDAEVRVYDYLFSDPDPDGPDKDFLEFLNPESLVTLSEPGKDVESFQFMRQGYFCLDNRDAKPCHLVFNRAVALKDSFKK